MAKVEDPVQGGVTVPVDPATCEKDAKVNTSTIDTTVYANTEKPKGGYDLKWVDEPPSELICQVCLCVAKDPFQHPGDSENECGKVFCSECINGFLQREEKCPNCQRSITIFRDSRSARNIRALKVKCNNLDNGCEWTGELGELDPHLQSCDSVLVKCPNACMLADSTEVLKILAKNLDSHLANRCPRRKMKCPLCCEEMEQQDLIHHDKKCARVRVSCPNFPCTSKILRHNIDLHLYSCKYQRVSCKYSEFGCEEKPLRKNLKRHEEDEKLHFHLATKRVFDLNTKVAELDSTLQKATTRPGIFKMANFKRYKDESSDFYSPSFYTSPIGYKMCVGVYANGNGEGKGSYMSVFAYLMKGDSDDSLTWPFTGTVTIEILNQLEDRNHYEVTTTFPAESQSSKRVMEGTKGEKGWGRPKFIAHCDLENPATMNCQYVKDDTLVFRVSVRSLSSTPWLECTM